MPDWLEVIARTSTLLVILFLMTKWLGKKQLSQLNIFEYIFGIVIGGTVAIHSSTLETSFVNGIIAMLVLFASAAIIQFIALKNKTFRDFFQGESTILIQNGKIMEDNMKKEGYSADELLENLRGKDIFQTADVEFALLEPSGALSVLPKKETQPLSSQDLGIPTASVQEPQTIIMDGKILLEPLANLSRNKAWLLEELKKQNVALDNVFLAQADQDGQITLDLYDDQIAMPAPTEKPLLLASMKKCQADLALFALSTDNTASKAMYERNSELLEEAIQEAEPFLQS